MAGSGLAGSGLGGEAVLATAVGRMAKADQVAADKVAISGGGPASGRVAAVVASWLTTHRQQSSSLLVACSGGADSLALADAVLQVAGDRQVAAATVDHGLQPGSAGRAVDTAELLRAMGFARVFVLTVVVDGGGGLEAAARRARYGALAEFAETECGGAAVLLGHTLDDQAETVLLGLSRGSGPRSIAGMRAWRAPWGRPLLGLRRADTEAACAAAGLPAWQDPHNSDPSFTRVRLRTEVLPLLERVLGGGVASALARTAALLEDDLVALDQMADRALAQSLAPDRSLDCGALSPWPSGIRRRVLRLWAGAGVEPGTAVEPVETGAADGAADGAGACVEFGAGGTAIALTADHLLRLDALVTAGRPGSSVRLPGGRDVVRDATHLTLSPSVARHLSTARVK